MINVEQIHPAHIIIVGTAGGHRKKKAPQNRTQTMTPSIETRTGANLITILVSGLVPSITKEELLQLFQEHGSVIAVDVVEGQNFGFVRMAYEAEGRKAISALNGNQCSGVMLSIGEARTRHKRAVKGNKVARATEVMNG